MGKDYGANGFLSKYMCEQLKVGETINFKHIDFNIKIPAPFKHKKIGMIAGGTGITPMIQALHAILGKGKDDQKSAPLRNPSGTKALNWSREPSRGLRSETPLTNSSTAVRVLCGDTENKRLPTKQTHATNKKRPHGHGGRGLN